MGHRKNNPLQRLLPAFVFFCFAGLNLHCSSQETGFSTAGTVTSEIGASGLQAEPGIVGTIIGNPTPPKQLIAFRTTSDANVADEVNCVDSNISELDVTRPVCTMTTKEFIALIVGIDAISCADESGAMVTCDETALAAGYTVTPLYRGEPIEVVIEKEGEDVLFPQGLISELPEGLQSFGALRISLARFGQRFPEESDSANAPSVTPELQGVAYSVCTLHSETSGELAQSACGQEESRVGDIFFDLNRDGKFGFLDSTSFVEGLLQETESRDANPFHGFYPSYKTSDGHVQWIDVNGDGAEYATWTLPLEQPLSSDAWGKISLSFDITGLLRFADGLSSAEAACNAGPACSARDFKTQEWKDRFQDSSNKSKFENKIEEAKAACDAALACLESATDGVDAVYDPISDGPFVTGRPSVTLTVE